MSKKAKRKLNIADGLRRITAIERKFPVVAREISKYCSKKKGQPDVITGQTKHVQGLVQKYNGLMDEWSKIKLAVQTANLETPIEYKGRKMSLAEAILWKGVRNARPGRKEFERNLWNSFTTDVADREIGRMRDYFEQQGGTKEEMEAANLVPELLGWDEIKVQEEKEFIMDFELELDAIIDRANIVTLLKL